jgi:hypothetical protein
MAVAEWPSTRREWDDEPGRSFILGTPIYITEDTGLPPVGPSACAAARTAAAISRRSAVSAAGWPG